MTKPSRLLGNRSYSVLVLIMLALVLPLTVVLVATAAPSPAPESSGLGLPADSLTPRAYLPIVVRAYPPLPVWTEVARSPGLENGWQTLGRWRRVSHAQGGDAYPGCIGATDPGCVYHPYEPTTGSNASWWTVGYNDSAWSAQGYVDWNSAWTTYGWTPIATIGEHIWKAEPGWPAGTTDLHRRTFEIAQGCSILDARLTLFSDNTSRWYINGTLVAQSEASASRLVTIPIAPFHSGSNLFAVQVSNDHVSLINNPFGIQYILEVQLLCGNPAPSLTTTATVSATLGQAIHDTAHLSGGTAPLNGTVTFNVYGPSDAACSTPIAVPPAIPVNGAGNYQSGNFTPTLLGTYRWIARYSGDANNQAVTTQCNDPNETTTVTSIPPSPPVLTTTATGPTPLGQAIHDTAYLSGGSAPLTGTLTFNVYGPDDATCSTPIAVPPAVTVNGAGSYLSGNYTPTAAGAYRWIAYYSGNANNPTVSTACNDLNETSTVFTLTLTTNASPVPIGQTIFDTAHLRGGHATPGGTITFDVFAPNDATCATPIAVPPAVTVNGAGDYASGNYTPTMTGNYRWIAHYSGDGINPALSTACHDPAEISSVQPGLSLAKSASPTIFTAVGQVVTYTYSVTNSGNVTLNGPITVSDDRATVTCPNVSTIAPGASITCSATYVVTQADMDNGSVTNHANAQAFFGGLPVISNPAQATVNVASIALSKSASPTTYSSAGEVITYTYTVTNTGHATLNGPVMVNDDKLGTFACGSAADLAPGASVTCTRTYVIQLSDLGNVLHLPIQQPTNVTYGTWLGGAHSIMDIILSGNAPGSDVPNGTFAGWCIDELSSGGLYDQLATLYTSTHLNLPADVASMPWGKVNYILNHKIRGIGKTDSEFFKDVQTAIWIVLGQPIPSWGISYDAQQMIDAANANPGYVPGLTDTVAVIVYADGILSDPGSIQETIIEAKLGQITNHATATATAGGITVTSNGAEVTIQFVPVYTAASIKIQNRPAVKSKS